MQVTRFFHAGNIRTPVLNETGNNEEPKLTIRTEKTKLATHLIDLYIVNQVTKNKLFNLKHCIGKSSRSK